MRSLLLCEPSSSGESSLAHRKCRGHLTPKMGRLTLSSHKKGQHDNAPAGAQQGPWRRGSNKSWYFHAVCAGRPSELQRALLRCWAVRRREGH
eukprot:2246400-Pyramimonas_sp.AAC.1